MASSCVPMGPIASWLANFHNLNALNPAGDLIKIQGDVRNRDVAYALLSVIAAAAS
jgi:hypothetical protein